MVVVQNKMFQPLILLFYVFYYFYDILLIIFLAILRLINEKENFTVEELQEAQSKEFSAVKREDAINADTLNL